jgi:hypothetical protein
MCLIRRDFGCRLVLRRVVKLVDFLSSGRRPGLFTRWKPKVQSLQRPQKSGHLGGFPGWPFRFLRSSHHFPLRLDGRRPVANPSHPARDAWRDPIDRGPSHPGVFDGFSSRGALRPPSSIRRVANIASFVRPATEAMLDSLTFGGGVFRCAVETPRAVPCSRRGFLGRAQSVGWLQVPSVAIALASRQVESSRLFGPSLCISFLPGVAYALPHGHQRQAEAESLLPRRHVEGD